MLSEQRKLLSFRQSFFWRRAIGCNGTGWYLGEERRRLARVCEDEFVPGAGDTDVEQAALLRKVCSAPGHLQRQCAFACTTEKNGGEFQALCLLGSEKNELLADVPLPSEYGLKDIDCSKWFWLGVHPDTPDEVVGKLYEIFSKAVEKESFKSFMGETKIDQRGHQIGRAHV